MLLLLIMIVVMVQHYCVADDGDSTGENDWNGAVHDEGHDVLALHVGVAVHGVPTHRTLDCADDAIAALALGDTLQLAESLCVRWGFVFLDFLAS